MTTLQTSPTQSMSVAPSDVSMSALESALAGDLKRLTTEDRLKYVARACELVGLNPLTKPFDFIELNGKLVLYANKSCAEQLRKLHGVSVDIIERKVEFGVLIVRTRATDREGRHDEALAAVPFNEKNPELVANAMMKAETKAKRRVTFSICGLGFASDYDGDTQRAEVQPINTETSSTSLAARLNATLTEGEKAKSITVESAPMVAAQPMAVKPAMVDAEIVTAAPAPVQNVTDETHGTNALKPAGGLADDIVEKLESILSSEGPEVQNKAIKYLIAKGKLRPLESLSSLKADAAAWVVKNPKQFHKMVADWQPAK